MALLDAWHIHQGKPEDDQPIVVESDIGCEAKRLATALRDIPEVDFSKAKRLPRGTLGIAALSALTKRFL